MSTSPPESPETRTLLLEPYDVMLVAKVVETVRHLNSIQSYPEYRDAAQQIYEFSEAVIDAFATHPEVNERALLEMLYTDSMDCYHVEIPTTTIIQLIPALKTFDNDDNGPFCDLLFIALMRWTENEIPV